MRERERPYTKNNRGKNNINTLHKNEEQLLEIVKKKQKTITKEVLNLYTIPKSSSSEEKE